MKNLKNLGKVLGKQEQKSINGGKRLCHIQLILCRSNSDCKGCRCLAPFGGEGYCI